MIPFDFEPLFRGPVLNDSIQQSTGRSRPAALSLCRGASSLVDRPRRRLTDLSEGAEEMSAIKIMGSVLIVAGIVALLYGKFNYTTETHDIKLGQLEMSFAEKQTVNVPVWAGVGAILGGGVLLLYASKKRQLLH